MKIGGGSRVGVWAKSWLFERRRAKRPSPRLEALEARCLLSGNVVQEYPLPAAVFQSGSVAAGADGNLWFTEDLSHEVGIFNPSSHSVTQVPIPGGVLPEEITAGPDGNLWFTAAPSTVGVINPTTHAVAEFSTPTAGSYPQGITAGPDGKVWFTESRGDQIGVIDPTTHAIKELAIPTPGVAPSEITAGPDGNLWFTEQGGLGEVDPTSHLIRNVPLAGGTPLGIARGADGNVWFVNGNTFGKVDPATLTVSQYTALAQDGGAIHPERLTLGPDGNLWFTDPFGKVGSFNTTTHAAVSYPTSDTGQPKGLVAGPDRDIWFVEPNVDEIGRVDLSQVTAATTIVLTSSSTAATVNQPITFTAIVSGPGATSPGGAVVFVIDGQAQPAVALSALGGGKAEATITTSELAAGPHVAAAVYTGDLKDAPSVSIPLILAVSPPSLTDGPRVIQFLAFPDGANPLTLLLIFDEPLSRTSALNPRNYRITAPNGQSFGVRRVKYYAGSQSVVLLPSKRINVNHGDQLTVIGTGPTGVSDESGRLLDGAGTGQPGSNYAATIGPGIVVQPRNSPATSLRKSPARGNLSPRS